MITDEILREALPIALIQIRGKSAFLFSVVFSMLFSFVFIPLMSFHFSIKYLSKISFIFLAITALAFFIINAINYFLEPFIKKSILLFRKKIESGETLSLNGVILKQELIDKISSKLQRPHFLRAQIENGNKFPFLYAKKLPPETKVRIYILSNLTFTSRFLLPQYIIIPEARFQ